MLIRRCPALPDNFPVTDDMVLHGQGSLRIEMKKGNIFLCDYKRLDGLKANIIDGKQQYLMAPLVLLHKTLDDKLMPIAIQLLIPHTRDTLEINFFARHFLISKTGIYPKLLVERGVLSYYYKHDAMVQTDSELQKWILDIFEHGFLSQTGTGIPKSFTTVAELIKFVTMVIFTCSGQHSAVNAGQYDYGGWMPNTPSTMQLPPPTTKGTTSKARMLQTLPNKGTTAKAMATVWLLSKEPSDFVPLGQYPEDHFSERIPCGLIKVFKAELEVLSAVIHIRNQNLDVPYTYMDPMKVENSVAL
ncbi:hypothetical protein FQN60_011883 [Etheostoma spectabile]|uniref:Lipoxygenase domain-containing protein n=1 Tax=Etheostoma spectabile TaxID=54343 RepID=A0A5J5DNI6_9PERO|nr:hypothetical protein FQN60_011883 [Etheostoma spectabile]